MTTSFKKVLVKRVLNTLINKSVPVRKTTNVLVYLTLKAIFLYLHMGH